MAKADHKATCPILAEGWITCIKELDQDVTLLLNTYSDGQIIALNYWLRIKPMVYQLSETVNTDHSIPCTPQNSSQFEGKVASPDWQRS